MSEIKYSSLARPQGRFEHHARFVALYGFHPIGEHTQAVREMFAQCITSCPVCNDTGLRGTFGNMGWRACPHCNALGTVYTIDPVQVEIRRRLLLKLYPNTDVKGWQPGLAPDYAALNLASGELLVGVDEHGMTQGELL